MDTTIPQRLVGFAFADSDFVFEVIADGLTGLARPKPAGSA